MFFLNEGFNPNKWKQILLFCHPTDNFSSGDKSSADGNLGSAEDRPSPATGRPRASRDAPCVSQKVSILTPNRPFC